MVNRPNRLRFLGLDDDPWELSEVLVAPERRDGSSHGDCDREGLLEMDSRGV